MENPKVSEDFKLKMNKLFKLDKRKTVITHIVHTTKKIGIVAAVFVAVFSVVLVTQPEVKAAVREVFVRWFDTHTQFTGDNNEIIYKDWKLSNIPDGYVEIANEGASDCRTIIYQNENNLIAFNYASESQSISVNNENIEFSQIVENGIIYYIFSAENSDTESSVVWDFENYRFCLSGTVPVEELLKMSKYVE
jgi:hypothetical protein